MKDTTARSFKNRFGNILLVILFSCIGLLMADSRAENREISQPASNPVVSENKTIALPPSPKHKPLPDLLRSGEKISQEEAVFENLNRIINTIRILKKNAEAKSELLKRARTEKEKTEILNGIDEINQSIKEQEKSFEMIQTGGMDLGKIEETHEESFDWQKNLLEILQPIMNELHQYTEDKRKLIELQNKISFYQSRIEDGNKALEKMEQIKKENLGKEALQEFEHIRNKWQNLLEDNKHQLDVAQLKLEGMLAIQSEKQLSFGEYFKQFVTGRGASIFMAVSAAFAVFFVMSLLWKGMLWLSTRKQNGKLSYLQRLINLFYHTMMVLFSIAAVFYVLNQRNDQVLVGMAVLVLIIIVWVLKNSIPRYFNELQVVLNAGSVREGERILYNGVPMKIEQLNFFTKLTNPAMPELELRLPLSEMNNYISRPYRDGEPWFPCQEGDFVLLSNGSCFKVKCITPEHVELTLGNGMMPHIYLVQDFLAANPKNLSQGFIVVSVIGIDYAYQQRCTTDVAGIFCEGIRNGLLREAYGRGMKDLLVYFEQANMSSLDYKIIALFDGSVAGFYNDISRDLQRFAVDVCNQQQWNIPFSQLVVHQAS